MVYDDHPNGRLYEHARFQHEIHHGCAGKVEVLVRGGREHAAWLLTTVNEEIELELVVEGDGLDDSFVSVIIM